MNAIDIVFGIILIAAAISGLRKGLVYEITSLIALILGIWGAIEFSYVTENAIQNWLDKEIPYIGIISFILTLALIVWLVHLIGKLAEKLVKAVALGPLNRILGMIFSFMKATFMLSVILMIFQFLDLNDKIFPKKAKNESYLYHPVRKVAPSVLNLFNIDFNKTLKDSENEIEPNTEMV